MTKFTKDIFNNLKPYNHIYLIRNKLDNEEGVKSLIQYLQYDVEIPLKVIKNMSLDEIIEAVIKDHKDNPIMGS